jgi:hypothetical protein
MVAAPVAPKAEQDKTAMNTQKRNIAIQSYPEPAFRHNAGCRRGSIVLRHHG